MVAGHWNRILSKWVMSSKLPEFKEHLDDALRHRISPVRNRVLNSRIFMSFFQLDVSYDSIINSGVLM